MNLAPITVDPGEAKAKLAEYSRTVAAERTAEDAAIAQAYRAVARGLPVIRLSTVIEAGGFFPDGLPRIAVVRANATECHVQLSDWWRHSARTQYLFGDSSSVRNLGAFVGRHTVRVDVPNPVIETGSRRTGGRTVVPIIPPAHRPRRPRLAACHLLWEVESWTPEPPRDPALIRHLRGDLWSVLSVWDLTDLERAVLGQRVS